MKTVHNVTPAPLRVPLPGGKTLHLGPGRSGQITDRAADHPPLLALVKAGKIEFVGGDAEGPAAEGRETRAVQGSTHGHPPPTTVMPKGDR